MTILTNQIHFLETIELKENCYLQRCSITQIQKVTPPVWYVHTGVEIVQYCLNPGLSQEM